MPTDRVLQPLPVPQGEAALDILPALRRALSGDGPALLPVPAGGTAGAGPADDPAAQLGAGESLGPGEDDPDDPTTLVVATSGSTGAAKGVLLSTGALRSSAEATHRHLGGPGHWLLAMPAQHIAGIQVLVRSITAGSTPHAVDTSDGFRPDRFTDAAQRCLAADSAHYTALVPTQLGRLLDDPAGLDALRRFDAVLLGGAATPPALLQRARDTGVQVVTTYGMSETAGGCVYDGTPLDIARVRIEADTPDPAVAEDPATTGRVLLSGPMLARGYRGRPADPAFARGWFRTGDLGALRDGTLEVLGRADDVIISGGLNIAPLPVEQVLVAQRGVREACVLGVPDPEWGQAVVAAVVPADPDAPPSAEALRGAVRERAPAAAPKHVEFLSALPLRGPGKPDRKALTELVRSRLESGTG
ncbi:AMP-binding protein [Saccharopolyspora sp. HNM0983]|uniref:AMP-binding protein n=1 Tax=Saccharopolyspora montiporae TaxID=2781240 RepID=A0A929FXP8_9PSEU|nr:o-succinylbenzoate--CoA ligase [Saccharopolyspora sp. HNM0983]MBE9374901.1 AMP-binding protein [Saccharopolyspora sp. HNM0983]